VGWSHLRDHPFPFHHHPSFTTANVPQCWRWCRRLSTPPIATPLTAMSRNEPTGETRERGNERTRTAPMTVVMGAVKLVSVPTLPSPLPSLTTHLRTSEHNAHGKTHETQPAPMPQHGRCWMVSGHPVIASPSFSPRLQTQDDRACRIANDRNAHAT
jgi:hypothetical protein